MSAAMDAFAHTELLLLGPDATLDLLRNPAPGAAVAPTTNA